MALVERYVTASGDNTDAQATYDAAVDVAHSCSLTVALKYATAGNLTYICGGTYTRTANEAVTNAGTAGSPNIFKGALADGTPISWSRALEGRGFINTNGWPVINYTNSSVFSSAASCIIDSLVISADRNGPSVILGDSSLIRNCSITNAGSFAGARCINTGSYGFIDNCDLVSTGLTSGGSIYHGGNFGYVSNTILKVNSTNTASYNINNPIYGSIHNCIFIGSGGSGILCATITIAISNCTFYGFGESAILTPNAASGMVYNVHNNIFKSCSYAVKNLYNATSAHRLNASFNVYHDVTNANLGFGDWPEQGRIDADPLFLDAANGDFRIAATSPAKGAALGGGDIGACQRAEGTIPAVADVESGVTYNVGGQEGTLTGELVVPSIGTVPSINDVQEGVSYNVGGDAGTLVGVFVSPAESSVEDGVDYGASGEFTGTLVAVIPDYPVESDVREAVDYASGASTGILALPDVAYVKKDITFGANSEFVGTYEVGAVAPPIVVPPVPFVENLILLSGIVTYVVFRSKIN